MLNEEYLLQMLINLFQKYEILVSCENSLNFDGLNYSEVHTLDCIEKNKDVNVTKLSKEMNMTKGALSKITKKLVNKNLITTYKKNNNKKEVYFKLTEAGFSIYEKHEKIHKDAEERDKKIFASFNDEERKVIHDFIKKVAVDIDKKIEKLNE
ncbi:MarR family transcriptional regulator [Clostridium sp. ZS2-4]|uniref:MarR family transcriptional regulator n=1 Tax=Clostridium sp. ZS2-4 TaxID=2987703 RepID=UPI00227B922F|nr:MarR family transcriptional regulator [Clostridium sp. ZS2-4]MCY6355063.1 MarR family transcriptional regulator [Clostridium sp. ZS2-4]